MYGVKVTGLSSEPTHHQGGERSHFDLVGVGNATNTSADVHNLTGAQIETNSQNGHVTGFERPEDGAWDTIDHNRFYFVTTASITGHSKLWELDFTDANNPALGGTIKMLLDGTEGQQMFDNITVSSDGKITLLEDVGNADVGKVWQYDPANTLTEITIRRSIQTQRSASLARTSLLRTRSSGVIDISTSSAMRPFERHQAHKRFGELVEGGQLMIMHQYLL
jgi:hypothetical protein